MNLYVRKSSNFMSMNGRFMVKLPEGMWCSAAPPESFQELKARQLPIPTSLQRTLLPEHWNLLCGQRLTKWLELKISKWNLNVVNVQCIPFLMNCSLSHGEPSKNESPYWDRHTRMEIIKWNLVARLSLHDNTIFQPSAPCCWWASARTSAIAAVVSGSVLPKGIQYEQHRLSLSLVKVGFLPVLRNGQAVLSLKFRAIIDWRALSATSA